MKEERTEKRQKNRKQCTEEGGAESDKEDSNFKDKMKPCDIQINQNVRFRISVLYLITTRSFKANSFYQIESRVKRVGGMKGKIKRQEQRKTDRKETVETGMQEGMETAIMMYVVAIEGVEKEEGQQDREERC